MKNILTYLFCLLLLGCASSKKYVEKGNYDAAIAKAVKNLRKNPESKKDATALETAYPLANQRDLDRIKYLKAEGKPESWDQILMHYNSLRNRQNMVKEILPLKAGSGKVSFDYVDYDAEIIAAKQKAAEYYYAHAKKLLESNDKYSARTAYNELQKVKTYYTNYADTDKLLVEAKQKGTTHVQIILKNETPVAIPPQLAELLLPSETGWLNSFWVEYHITPKGDITFDNTVVIRLKLINVGPEQRENNHYTESKQVQDGWDYFLDAKGNVMKDSAGNDIKKPKYKTLSCSVLETTLKKMAHIEASVDFIDNQSKQTLKLEPIAADNFFTYKYATANGDLSALKDDTKKIIGLAPIPFPTDGEMIMRAAEILNRLINAALSDNKYFIK